MKRKLFIGSSGNGLTIAHAAADRIHERCGEWIQCEVWDRGDALKLNQSFLDSLTRAAQRFHYGVFIATADDATLKKDNVVMGARDNVIFEMGLFLGGLGPSRAFLIVEKDVDLPTDFDGIKVPKFEVNDEKGTIDAVDAVLSQIECTRESFNLKPIPPAALALGYFENFLKQFGKMHWRDSSEPARVRVLLPKGLISLRDTADLGDLTRAYQASYPSDDVSLFKPGERPVIKRMRSSVSYWDLPTTVFTLKTLNDCIPSGGDAVGIDPAREQRLLDDLLEFGQAVRTLTSGCPAFQQGIATDVVLLELDQGRLIETPLEQK